MKECRDSGVHHAVRSKGSGSLHSVTADKQPLLGSSISTGPVGMETNHAVLFLLTQCHGPRKTEEIRGL